MAFIKQQLQDILPLLIQTEAALAASQGTSSTALATDGLWLGWDAWVNRPDNAES